MMIYRFCILWFQRCERKIEENSRWLLQPFAYYVAQDEKRYQSCWVGIHSWITREERSLGTTLVREIQLGYMMFHFFQFNR